MKSKGNSGGSYTVGYGKPPRHSRFKPGQTGNPKGRPKGSRNRVPPEYEDNRLRAVISDEANRLITIQEPNGMKTKIPAMRAVMRSIAVNAMKGHPRAQQLFTDLVGHNEHLDQQERQATFEHFARYKRDWAPQFARDPSLSQLPHPADVFLDLQTGAVRIAGPGLEEERPAWERWRKIRAVVDEELKEWHAARTQPAGRECENLATLAPRVEETLTAIDLALGGSRAVMKFLESLELTEIEHAMRAKKRRRGRRQYVWPIVHRAMYKGYITQTE
jgi:hypothetical protein